MQANCLDFTKKGQWLPNSLNINPMHYSGEQHLLKAYHKLKTKPKTIAELKEALQVIWDNLPPGLIDKFVKDFSN